MVQLPQLSKSAYHPADVKEVIEIVPSMVVRVEMCPRCGRMIKVLNYRGDKGLREFDFFKKHSTDPYKDIVCSGGEKFLSE